ncbi:MAG: polysaccharide deacetylase family protein [Planctomycetaceae bacterium]|nr:polysaccharide deacetylase family protein [Planctomycetaceae bacterium]
MFHRIGTPDPCLSPLQPKDYVTTETFRSVIADIAEHRRPISIPELVRCLQSGRVPDRAVAVTFDDGFADNLTIALPILEQYQVPATVYVTTGFIDRSVRPFQYDLAALICRSDYLALQQGQQKMSWKIHSDSDRRSCFASLYRLLKPASHGKRTNLMSCLVGDCTDLPDYSSMYLTREQLQQLSASPRITIGAHTHKHLQLNAVDANQMRADIAAGHETLERLTGRAIEHFSYPYGEHSRSVQRTVKEIGLSSAVSVGNTYWWRGTNMFDIRRSAVEGDRPSADSPQPVSDSCSVTAKNQG